MHNPDPARQAKLEEAKAKRQRAIEYGNSALKAATREGDLKDLKKQVGALFHTDGCRAWLEVCIHASTRVEYAVGQHTVAQGTSRNIPRRKHDS